MSATPQDVVNALYTKLTASQGAGTLYAAVSGRIFHGQAHPNTALPQLVFHVIDNEVLHNFSSTTFRATVQFDLWGPKTAGMAATLGDAEGKLFTLLDKVTISPTGFDRGVISFTARYGASIEEDAWRITDEATITGTV